MIVEQCLVMLASFHVEAVERQREALEESATVEVSEFYVSRKPGTGAARLHSCLPQILPSQPVVLPCVHCAGWDCGHPGDVCWREEEAQDSF